MRGFTLIEILIAMTILSITIVTIMMSILRIEDIYTNNKELTYLVHIAESKLNNIKGIRDTNICNFNGKIKNTSFFWTIDSHKLYNGFIWKVEIKISGEENDNMKYSLKEYILMPSKKATYPEFNTDILSRKSF